MLCLMIFSYFSRVYCEYKYEQPLDAPYMESQEALLLHFLGKAQKPGWRWSSTRTNQPPDSTPENCELWR